MILIRNIRIFYGNCRYFNDIFIRAIIIKNILLICKQRVSGTVITLSVRIECRSIKVGLIIMIN